jgi:hypothetical protein
MPSVATAPSRNGRVSTVTRTVVNRFAAIG